LCYFSAGALFGDFPELLFPLGLILKALVILIQSQGMISFLGLATVAKVAMGLDHERSGASCLILRRFLGLSWGDFCWVLVFVILTFFEEGIGNNLTMPSWGLGSGAWGLGSWSLEMDLGIRDLGTGTGHW
jgi:hypothetical protein